MRDWRFWGLALLCLIGGLVAVGRTFELSSEARDAILYPPPGKFVGVGDRRRLHIFCRGDAAGPTVVMIAGGGTPAVVSYELQGKIARFARVCSYDRPGLGWSPPAQRPLTFDEHAADLEALLHNAGVRGPYLLAPESFGGLIAIAYARAHPQETAGIVFLDGVDPRLWFSALPEQAGWDADVKTALIGAAQRVGIVRLAFGSLAPPWLKTAPTSVQSAVRAIYSRPAAGFDEALQAYRRSAPEHRPVLTPLMLADRPVIAVEHGRTTAALSSAFERGWAASQRRLAGASRIGRIVIVSAADHEVAQEAPDLAAEQVREASRR